MKDIFKGEVGMFTSVNIPTITEEQKLMLSDIELQEIKSHDGIVKFKVKDGVIYVFSIDLKLED